MILIEWVFNIVFLLILLGIPVSIVYCIIDISIGIKCPDRVMRYKYLGGSCWGMKGCGDDSCHLKNLCYLHKDTISLETIEELERLLKERRTESDNMENQ